MTMAEQQPQRLYDLVVIGASAGGIEALSLLVATLPKSFSVPIVVAQHIDPNATSHLDQILSRRTTLPVRAVVAGAPAHLEDGVIYVIPANNDVEISDDVVHLAPAAGQRAMPSIDRLLTSAARAYGERLIAVILTGSGTDGTVGAREVKAAGGAVVIENPATASYPSMPASLAPTTVDLVVDLARIGPLLVDLISGAQDLTTPVASNILPDLLEKVRQHTGIDFAQYKNPTILRRLHRRMAATGAGTLPEYVRLLDERPEEYQRLVASFLINVTEFFRDQPLYNFLREDVIPELIAHARASGKELRIWSAGCATGEEPYSIAILLAEALGIEAPQFNIRIFATDVDSDAITFARRGRYPPSSLTSMSDDLRTRYFIPVERGYEVSKFIRNMVIYGEHDLGQRAPFPRMDMVFCRNVLIYFTNELQTRALQAIAFSLRDGGYLALGNAETAGSVSQYYALVHPRYRVYRRRGARVLPPTLPVSIMRMRAPPMTPPLPAGEAPIDLNLPTEAPRGAPAGGQALFTMEASGGLPPAYEIGARVYTPRERFADQILSLAMGVVVIDRNYDIQTINNAAYTLLDIHRPAIGKDLLHLATRVPTKPLRAAIDTIFQQEEGAAPPGAVTITLELEHGEQEDRNILQMSCYPYARANETPSQGVPSTVEAVILFISEVPRAEQAPDAAEAQASAPAGEQAQGVQGSAVQVEEIARLTRQLEAERALNHELRLANLELRETGDTLRRSNEDLLVAQEEAQASSEEITTLNEEMQATNEEMETLNEELEATVEELRTTNDDLLARAQELQALAQEKETQRQASERERAQLEAILLSMGDALIAVDASRQRTLTNEAYHRFFGDADGQLPIEDMLGNPLPPEAAPWRRVGEAEPYTMAFTILAPDGSRRWFEANGQPIRSGESKLGGVVTIRDLSDRSIRGLYERFLARASHELKNPLTSLMITLEMLQRQLPTGAAGRRQRAMVANAMRYSHRLDVMANDLKDLQRIQHDKLDVTLERLDLVALVRQTVDDVELIQPPDEPHPAIVVQAQPESAPPIVLGDAVRIQQVLENLLTNALKYAPESKRIDVRVRRVQQRDIPDTAELEVRDYGPGIAERDLKHLFTPFYQAPHEREPLRGGLGLGLYIVQQLVTALGGDITARSVEGQGATFTIHLPLAAEGEQAALPASGASQEPDADAQDGK
jgi:two-component system, chemotaxis family, CheB/CheR fusion protein